MNTEDQQSILSQIRIAGSRLSEEETAALLAVFASALAESPDQSENSTQQYSRLRRRQVSTWAASEVHTWKSAAGVH